MSRTVRGFLFCLLLMLAGCGVEWLPSGGNTLEPTPADFTFDPKLCQPASTQVSSADVTVTGVTSQATVKIIDGEYSVDQGVTWFSTASFVTPTEQKLTIRVRHTTAAITATSSVVITRVTIGNTTGVFYSDIARTTACP